MSRGRAVRRTPMWFYRLALPLVWGLTSLGATRHAGDEYALWGVGSFAGLWALYFAGKSSSIGALMPKVIVAGVVTVALLGWAMDALRVRRRLWLALWLGISALIAATSISEHPTLARAIAKHGSITAYLLFGSNLGLCFASLIAVAVTPLLRLHRRRPRAGHCPACDYDLTGNITGVCPECGVPCVKPEAQPTPGTT